MATPPVRATSGFSTFNDNVGSKNASVGTTAIGDLIVISAGGEAGNGIAFLTTTGANATPYTVRGAENTVSDVCDAAGWSAPVTSAGTGTATVTTTGSGHWGFAASRFSSHNGIGNSGYVGAVPTSGTDTGATPSFNFTTAGDNSGLLVLVGDWRAVGMSGVTWRQINGISPTVLVDGAVVGGSWGWAVLYYPDTGAAGVKALGATAGFANSRLSMNVIEVLGTGLSGPTNTVAPVVTGTNVVGSTLSSTTGSWTGTGTINYARQWIRNGVDIGGATSSTYVQVTADIGTEIQCRVTATDDNAPTNALSNIIYTQRLGGPGTDSRSLTFMPRTPRGYTSIVMRDELPWVATGGDVTPPGTINVTVFGPTKISSKAGMDSTDISWSADEHFVEYQVRRVSSGADTVAMGSLIESGTVPPSTSWNVLITDDELIAASGVEGVNIIKVFVRDAAGNWST